MRIRTLSIACCVLGLLVAMAPSSAWAQQTQKRSEVELWPVGPPEEVSYRPWDPYDLSVMLEFGGQIADVDGNHEMWESQQNYRDGFKVFDFNLRGEAQDDSALLTDFYVEGGGWVNEPYSWVRFGLSREKWFEFRGTFRESEYNWLFPGFGRSQHLNDTTRRLQNYKLTFFPKQKFRVRLGYKRNSSFGPSLTTFDFSRGEFPVFEPIRQTYDEYTIGAEWNIQRWLIIGEYGYRFFRNDRFLSVFDNDANALLVCGAASCPNDPGDAALLFEFERVHPSRGKIPWASLTIVGRPHRTLEVNTRLVYSRAESEFTRTEIHDGITFTGVPTIVNFEAFGDSTRPMTTLDGNLTWRPVAKFSVTNNFEYRGYDIAGFQDETQDVVLVPEEIRRFWSPFIDLDAFRNRTELRYDFAHWFGVRGGFNFLHRDFTHGEFFQEFEDGILVDEDIEVEGFDFINRSWLFGADLRLNRRLQFFLDGEVGDNTRVFTRTGPAKMDRYRLRGRFEPIEGARLNASWFIFDNQNFNLPTAANPDARHSSRNRGFSVDFQLSRFDGGYFDVGYSRNDVTAITDVTNPRFGPPLGGLSLYILNDNYFFVDAGGRLGKLYVDVGYRVSDSSGTFPPSDPFGICIPFVVQSCDNTELADRTEGLDIFDGGLTYHQPHVAVRYSFSDNVNWKVGWRYYDYNQEGGTFSDYDSHVVTTSMVLNF